MTKKSYCRLCGGDFFSTRLLAYPDAPHSAQGFTEKLSDEPRSVDLNIYQCSSCGLVQHSLEPVSYYKDVIRAIAFSPEMAAFRVKQLGSWLQKYDIAEKRILEIGSGRGEYLHLLMQSGASSVFGIENSDENIAIGKLAELDIRKGYLDTEFSNPWPFKFDAFVTFSFMEHWPNLNSSLRSLNTILNSEAIGLVEVPNFDYVIQNGMYSEFTTDHIFYFNKAMLKSALEFNGFEVLEINSVWHDYILSAEVKKRKQLDLSHFNLIQHNLVKQIHDYVLKFSKKDVVIWGAGHQALAVISIAALNKMASHIVDSAPFKQGKFSPGSNMLIKSPESLKIDRPSAIIIMAAGYSNEVAEHVRLQFPEIKHVAILREDTLEIIRSGE